MTLRLIIRNLLYKPLSTILSWILLLVGVAIISLLLIVQQQLEQKFDKDLQDVDMVIGAKGSPLQLVLSAIYHVDAPTGNVSESEVNRITASPLIEQTIPLAYGDNYKGYTILGTDTSYISKEKATLLKGRLFNKSMEAVVGSNVASAGHLGLDSTFLGIHGQGIHGHQHKGHYYKVVGILQPTGAVIDNLVITNIATIREIHEHHDADDHDDDDDEKKDGAQITAALIKFRSPMGLMVLPRIINETTNMQAAAPVLEINRLVGLMGIGVTTLQYIAVAIIVMAGLSVFISLFNRLNERRYEMALLRSMGYSRSRLFMIIIAEGLLLALVGFISGILLSRLGVLLLGGYASGEYHINFRIIRLLPGEWILAGITIGIGVLAALFPALSVYRLNISKTLADE